MPMYRLEGVTPVVDPSAYVHPTAVLIGDVIIGPGCYVGPNACLRGDFGRLVMERGSNIQDNCVMHGFPATETVIRENGHVGHGAILHGCEVGVNVLIGMNAVIMDGAIIGESSIVAANAFVKAGFECPPRSMLMGSPATVTRVLRAEEIGWKEKGTAEYHRLTERCLHHMVSCDPLPEIEADRPALQVGHVKVKSQH